jgi:3-hydroxyisobutyrate dehydrogenase-like beta-hydroxyacid dehydrogenase
MPSDAPVGIVGLGLIGAALSERLIEAGMEVIGFDIDSIKCSTLQETGGTVAASIPELSSRCPTIIIAVYSGAQAEALFAEIEMGAGPAARPTVICTTTCAPDEIGRLARRAANNGIAFVEAPISGTSVEARDGAATALIGGDGAAVEAAGNVLEILCPHRLSTGAVGDACRTKLAINLILQTNRAALAEGLAFAERIGLDGRAFLAAACQSAAYSRVMDSKGEKMIAGDFRPQSHIAQTLKDAELILEEAARHDLHLPMTSAQAGLLRAAIELEGPQADSAAVISAIRQRPVSSGISR